MQMAAIRPLKPQPMAVSWEQLGPSLNALTHCPPLASHTVLQLSVLLLNKNSHSVALSLQLS
jgi:hypothetical protein